MSSDIDINNEISICVTTRSISIEIYDDRELCEEVSGGCVSSRIRSREELRNR